MAVTVLHRSRAHSPLVATSVPIVALLVTLIPPAFDLLATLQPGFQMFEVVVLVGSAVAALSLILVWARYPRTNWLFAACVAAVGSASLRVAGADVAPLLSLLAILALGVGGAFASRARDLDPLTELQPSVARR
jgi:hypothetical protein